MPLWTDIPSAKQAGRIIEEHVLNPAEFWGTHGVYSLDRSHPLFQDGTVSDLRGCGCGWNGPYWLPINYVVYHAMRRHGYHEAANELLNRQIRLVEECGDAGHNIQEYWLTDGKPGRLYPFSGWSCLIPFMALESLYEFNPSHL